MYAHCITFMSYAERTTFLVNHVYGHQYTTKDKHIRDVEDTVDSYAVHWTNSKYNEDGRRKNIWQLRVIMVVSN
jgi:hypothetical protein